MPSPLDAERPVFIFKARQAAHQCLFFLKLLRSQRVGSSAGLAADGDSQTIGPERFVDRVLSGFGWSLSPEGLVEYRAFVHRQMCAIAGSVRSPPAGEGDPVVQQWSEVCDKLRAGFGPADVQPLIDSIHRLLDVSSPTEWAERLDARVRLLLLGLRNNLALAIAAVGVWAVFFRVEAVHSLIWNAGFVRVAKSWAPFVLPFLLVAAWEIVTRKGDGNVWRRSVRLARSAWARIKYQPRPPDSGIARWPPGRRLIEEAIFSRQLVKVVIALVFMAAAEGILYLVAAPTTSTIYLIAAVCVVALIVAHGLDYWDAIEAPPIRFLALLSLLGSALFATESAFYRFVMVAAALAVGGVELVKYAREKPRRPLKLVLAMALGLVAVCVGLDLVSGTLAFLTAMVGVCIWRARVLFDSDRRTLPDVVLFLLSFVLAFYPAESTVKEHAGIWHENATVKVKRIPAGAWPLPGDDGPVAIMAASGGGSRAAIYTAFTLERLVREIPEVADHLQAMSSVSGGSLATAAYVALRYNEGDHFGAWAGALPPEPPAGELVTGGALVRAMSDDFLLPTLWGALWPGSSRGDSIETTWRNGPAALRDIRAAPTGAPPEADPDLSIENLVMAWNEAIDKHARLPPFPIPLFNTCTLDQHDVVISPLDAAYYTELDRDAAIGDLALSADLDEHRDWLTWVAERDAIYGLDVLLPKYDVALPKAVRASANFPFGFPLVSVRTDYVDKWYRSPKAQARGDVKLTDGGVLSNSGLWPLYPLLANPALAETLERRGVLLIIVEASKMPEYSADRRDLTTLYGDLNSRAPVAQALHRRILEGLSAKLDGAFAVEEIDVTPRAGIKSANVMTTWALDPSSQRSLTESFTHAWTREKGRIRADWGCLRQQGAARLDCLKAARTDLQHDEVALRPPLD